MGDEIELYPGDPGDPESGDGWKPRVALEQADRNGVGVIVGETAEGYAEGIGPDTFEAMAAHLTMDSSPKIEGYCPMGCGPTLAVVGGKVGCTSAGCEDPNAVHTILSDRETEHVVLIESDGFTITHPLKERLPGERNLENCPLHFQMTKLDGPPQPEGRYRVKPHRPDPVSESYRSGPLAGWDFERLPDLA